MRNFPSAFQAVLFFLKTVLLSGGVLIVRCENFHGLLALVPRRNEWTFNHCGDGDKKNHLELVNNGNAYLI